MGWLVLAAARRSCAGAELIETQTETRPAREPRRRVEPGRWPLGGNQSHPGRDSSRRLRSSTTPGGTPWQESWAKALSLHHEPAPELHAVHLEVLWNPGMALTLAIGLEEFKPLVPSIFQHVP